MTSDDISFTVPEHQNDYDDPMDCNDDEEIKNLIFSMELGLFFLFDFWWCSQSTDRDSGIDFIDWLKEMASILYPTSLDDYEEDAISIVTKIRKLSIEEISDLMNTTDVEEENEKRLNSLEIFIRHSKLFEGGDQTDVRCSICGINDKVWKDEFHFIADNNIITGATITIEELKSKGEKSTCCSKKCYDVLFAKTKYQE